MKKNRKIRSKKRTAKKLKLSAVQVEQNRLTLASAWEVYESQFLCS